MRDGTMLDNNARVLELEKENHRLAKKVEKLQESCSKETQQVKNLLYEQFWSSLVLLALPVFLVLLPFCGQSIQLTIISFQVC